MCCTKLRKYYLKQNHFIPNLAVMKVQGPVNLKSNQFSDLLLCARPVVIWVVDFIFLPLYAAFKLNKLIMLIQITTTVWSNKNLVNT
jgi:hypothetical protein